MTDSEKHQYNELMPSNVSIKTSNHLDRIKHMTKTYLSKRKNRLEVYTIFSGITTVASLVFIYFTLSEMKNQKKAENIPYIVMEGAYYNCDIFSNDFSKRVDSSFFLNPGLELYYYVRHTTRLEDSSHRVDGWKLAFEKREYGIRAFQTEAYITMKNIGNGGAINTKITFFIAEDSIKAFFNNFSFGKIALANWEKLSIFKTYERGIIHGSHCLVSEDEYPYIQNNSLIKAIYIPEFYTTLFVLNLMIDPSTDYMPWVYCRTESYDVFQNIYSKLYKIKINQWGGSYGSNNLSCNGYFDVRELTDR